MVASSWLPMVVVLVGRIPLWAPDSDAQVVHVLCFLLACSFHVLYHSLCPHCVWAKDWWSVLRIAVLCVCAVCLCNSTCGGNRVFTSITTILSNCPRRALLLVFINDVFTRDCTHWMFPSHPQPVQKVAGFYQ